jgi:hypothetical protein
MLMINSLVKGQSNDVSFLNSQPHPTGEFGDNKEARRLQDIKKTLFLRTPRKIEEGDFEILYFLNLFGVKSILNKELKYAIYMKEKLDSAEIDAFDNHEIQNMVDK